MQIQFELVRMSSSTCRCLRWSFRLSDWEPTRAEWTQILQSIQPEEITRVNRFLFRDDSKSAAIGRVMMRAALSRVMNVPWGQIRLGRSERGKPVVISPTDTKHWPSFNISHDGDYVVMATYCGSMCGVDVVKNQLRPGSQKTVKEYVEFLKGQFSQNEWKTLEHMSLDNEKQKLFYRYWCLKESYVKAIGTGIHSDLASLDFRYPNDDPSMSNPVLWVKDKSTSDKWRFYEYNLDDDHMAAVCIDSGPEYSCQHDSEMRTPFERISIRELLENTQPFHQVDEEAYDNFCAKSQKTC